MDIPPPLLARAFADLDKAYGGYHETEKLAFCPFPFPYAAALEMMLVVHTVITPICISTFVDIPFFAAFLTFMLMFVVWSLHLVASELENPFGGDDNDLPVAEFHCALNQRLLTLVRTESLRTPSLSLPVEAAEDRADALRRVLSHKAFYGGSSGVNNASFREMQQKVVETEKGNVTSSVVRALTTLTQWVSETNSGCNSSQQGDHCLEAPRQVSGLFPPDLSEFSSQVSPGFPSDSPRGANISPSPRARNSASGLPGEGEMEI